MKKRSYWLAGTAIVLAALAFAAFRISPGLYVPFAGPDIGSYADRLKIIRALVFMRSDRESLDDQLRRLQQTFVPPATFSLAGNLTCEATGSEQKALERLMAAENSLVKAEMTMRGALRGVRPIDLDPMLRNRENRWGDFQTAFYRRRALYCAEAASAQLKLSDAGFSLPTRVRLSLSDELTLIGTRVQVTVKNDGSEEVRALLADWRVRSDGREGDVARGVSPISFPVTLAVGETRKLALEARGLSKTFLALSKSGQRQALDKLEAEVCIRRVTFLVKPERTADVSAEESQEIRKVNDVRCFDWPDARSQLDVQLSWAEIVLKP
jgi:hypothetical protein